MGNKSSLLLLWLSAATLEYSQLYKLYSAWQRNLQTNSRQQTKREETEYQLTDSQNEFMNSVTIYRIIFSRLNR